MKRPVILASLLLASTAYAQAPGDYYGGDYGPSEEQLAAPSMVPVVAPVVVAAPSRVRRWSVGLGLGALELAPHSNANATTNFDIAQIYVRYRPWRRLEIELALGGGGETNYADGTYGHREVSSAVLSLRYRFNPQRRWNWWLMAGMGSLAVTRQGASDAELEAAYQSTLQFGAGVERRWRRFALQFEIRAVGVAPHETEQMQIAPDIRVESTQPVAPSGHADNGMAGGQFVFSGNYYF